MGMTIAGVEKRGSTYFLPVSEILVDQANNGREYKPTKDDLSGLKESIRANGQQTPCKVRSVKTEDGMQAVLVFGFRRVEAIRQINDEDGTDIPVECVGESRINEEDAYRMNVAENEDREGFTPIDYARQIKRWRSHFRKTTAEIAQIYGQDERWVTETEKLMSLPSDVRREIHAGAMTKSAGLDIAAMPQELQEKVMHHLAQIKETEGESKPDKTDKKSNRKGKIDRKAVAAAARAAGAKRTHSLSDLWSIICEAAGEGSQIATDMQRYRECEITEETLLRRLKAC